MRLLRSPAGVDLEYLVTGSGAPVSVFAHGLAASIAETRPLASGVPGTRAFLHFRGHGGSATPETGWTYADLAGDLRAVADEVGATRALGVSMGAGALCRLLADTPDRFDRLVFFLPAVIDRPRGPRTRARLAALAAAVDAGEPAAVAAEVRAGLPAGVAALPGAEAYVRQRARALLGTGVGRALAALPAQVAVPDRGALARCAVPALVLGVQGDPLHPASVAAELAALLPRAELHVYPRPGVLWTDRADLRARISGFLGG